MQNIVFYVTAAGSLGECRDSLGAKSVSAPTLVRGARYCLKMRLFANSEDDTAFPLSQLSEVASWQWAMDDDFDSTSNYILIGDNGNISASQVTEEIDGTERDFTEVSIPMPDTNTSELETYLGTAESKNTLNGELAGYNSSGELVFILQVKSFTIRNRITSTGNPTSLPSEYLTETQIRSLLAAGFEAEFCATASQDETDWHATQDVSSDHFVRFRIRGNANGAWSDALELIQGPQGEAGVSSHLYVAYAVDDEGTGFSLTPSDTLKYRAEIVSESAIASPSASDFADAVWVKYLGDDAFGGDMSTTVYDTDHDGKVDSAEVADAVPWGGITGKPSTFAPSSHTHGPDTLTDKARQTVFQAANPTALRLNANVIYNTTVNQTTTLTIGFGSFYGSSGSAYTGQPGDFMTWEYHVTCSLGILTITLGSNMIAVDMPDELDLVNAANTTHVFVVRAIYKSGAANNLRIFISYAYSYEA